MTSWSEFFDAVVAMRKVQKSYFRERRNGGPATSELLNRSKELEKQVDEAIESHQSRVNRGPELFDQGSTDLEEEG
jgi:hypothetical protein